MVMLSTLLIIGAPARCVILWGERRHRVPNDARRQSCMRFFYFSLRFSCFFQIKDVTLHKNLITTNYGNAI